MTTAKYDPFKPGHLFMGDHFLDTDDDGYLDPNHSGYANCRMCGGPERVDGVIWCQLCACLAKANRSGVSAEEIIRMLIEQEGRASGFDPATWAHASDVIRRAAAGDDE